MEKVISNFRSRTAYGPHFPCTVCGGCFFRGGVVPSDKVNTLCSISGLNQHVHPVAVADPRFSFQGACLVCQLYLQEQMMPPMAMVNILTPTWLSAPASLTSLSSVEREVLASHLSNLQPLDKVSELRHGVCSRGPPVKTLHMLTPKPGGKNLLQVVSRQG